MKNLKYYLKKAQKEKWAIGQFNFSTLEVFQAIVEVAIKLKSPVILGTSEGESKFFDIGQAVALRDYYRKKYNFPIFLNLDHGRDLSYIKKAVEIGYDAVHFDGSELSLSKNLENLKKLRKFIDFKKSNTILEGELGEIKGASCFSKKIPTVGRLTDPIIVKDFCKNSKLDSLAISIGSAHGVYSKEPKIDFQRLKEIRQKTNAFLVLHGGSGLSVSVLKKAIKDGIVKININTELRMIWRKGLEKSFENSQNQLKPYLCLECVKKNIEKRVSEKIIIFNSENKV